MSGFGFFAFIGFDSVGPAELVVLFAVILIVVGPKNMPAAARKLGSFMATLRRAADEFKRQLMTMDAEDATPSTTAGDSEPPPPPPPSDTYIDVPPSDSAASESSPAPESAAEAPAQGVDSSASDSPAESSGVPPAGDGVSAS